MPLFVPLARLRSPSALLQGLLPILVSGLVLALYNHLRWGSFITSYGGPHASELGFTTPLSLGLRGLLLSPGKSIFVFNPLAVLGVFGLVLMFRRDRALALLIVFLVVPRLVFFAMWSSWDGGWTWGPRFLLPAVPLLTLAAVDLVRAAGSARVWRTVVTGAACTLATIAVIVNFLGVRVPYEQWLSILQNRPSQSVYLIPDPRSANYDLDLASGPLSGDIILLDHGAAQMAPYWWGTAHHPLWGCALIAGGAGLLAGGVWMAVIPVERRRRPARAAV